MIKEEKKKPEFVKIDYLRFNNKSELLEFKNNTSLTNDLKNHYSNINLKNEKFN
jgi:hypothetical protein